MATIAAGGRQEKLAQWRSGVRHGMRRSLALLAGGAGGALALLAGPGPGGLPPTRPPPHHAGGGLALASYHPTDPALNTAAAGPVRNWIGAPGAWTADLLLSLFGPASALLLPLVALIGLRIARGAGRGRWVRALVFTMLGMILFGAAASLVVGGAVNGLPAAWGGAFGLSFARLIDLGIGALGTLGLAQPLRMAVVGLATVGGIAFLWAGLALAPDERAWI